MLRNQAGGTVLAFQKVDELPEGTWPDGRSRHDCCLNAAISSERATVTLVATGPPASGRDPLADVGHFTPSAFAG